MAKLIRYQATAPVTLGAGAVLGLSPAQAASRRSALQTVADGVFAAVAPLQFKAGEVFGYEGPLPKALADSLEPVAKVARSKTAEDVT
jgi:hypothetical protein